MSKDLLVITTNCKLSTKDYERYYDAFVAEKAMGTVLIPLGFTATVIPDDLTIKLEANNKDLKENIKIESNINEDTRTLRRILLQDTESRSLCLIRQDGYIIASTIIDNEDLFISSIDGELLNKKVKQIKTQSSFEIGNNVWDGLVYLIDI